MAVIGLSSYFTPPAKRLIHFLLCVARETTVIKEQLASFLIFKNIYAWGCFACMRIYEPRLYLVPKGTRRRHWISWNLS